MDQDKGGFSPIYKLASLASMNHPFNFTRKSVAANPSKI